MGCLPITCADFPSNWPALASPGWGFWEALLLWSQTHPLLASAILLSLLAALAASIWMYQRGEGVLRPFGQTVAGEAEERARALLRENLAADQYRQLLRLGYLEIPSRLHPGRCYRIPNTQRGVQVYEGGRRLAVLCLISRDPVPYADLILAQKLLLEADEKAYLSIANRVGSRNL